jgi:hypothetical protein
MHSTPRDTAHTVPEPIAADYLGLSRAYLRQGRQHGRGPAYIRIGRTIRYRVADLDAFLAQHRVEPRAEGTR